MIRNIEQTDIGLLLLGSPRCRKSLRTRRMISSSRGRKYSVHTYIHMYGEEDTRVHYFGRQQSMASTRQYQKLYGRYVAWINCLRITLFCLNGADSDDEEERVSAHPHLNSKREESEGGSAERSMVAHCRGGTNHGLVVGFICSMYRSTGLRSLPFCRTDENGRASRVLLTSGGARTGPEISRATASRAEADTSRPTGIIIILVIGVIGWSRHCIDTKEAQKKKKMKIFVN